MLTHLQREQFNTILEELGKNLDITPAQYENIVRSYEAVGLHLAKHDSLLHKYNPQIQPQGSMLLGVIIQPIHEDDDLDVDLVCQLTGKDARWTQYDLKQIVGQQIASHGTYGRMLVRPDGRRCWTLEYAESARFHMDILPCIVDSGYRILLEKAFSESGIKDVNGLALRITDKEDMGYRRVSDHQLWLKSNPFGYARWFFQRAELSLTKAFSLNESIQPLPKYNSDKLPLQRAIQIMKRHRDMIYGGDDNKPISIIITTLAATAYNKEVDVLTTLENVVAKMKGLIEKRYDVDLGKYVKWVPNPINPVENFADKWQEHPEREKKFYQWLEQLQVDIHYAMSQIGVPKVQEALSKSFGEIPVTRAFYAIGEQTRINTQSGRSRLDVVSGITSTGATVIRPHNFFGK